MKQLLPFLAVLALAMPAVAAPAPEALYAAAAGVPAGGSMSATVYAAGRTFLGKPYAAGTLNAYEAPAGEGEPLICRLDAFDCVTFVESSVAIARTVAAGDRRYEAFQHELEALRYRNGRREGYASRLHYFSDWVADNARRGLVRDLTRVLGGVPDRRPVRFMSTHRASYRKLADNATFQAIVAQEAGLARQARYVLPREKVAGALPMLQSGDILAFTTNIADLDVVHTALVARLPGGAVHLMHAPEPGADVQISKKGLVEYLAAFKDHTGLIVARPLAPATRTP